jgi:hypothetical protein
MVLEDQLPRITEKLLAVNAYFPEKRHGILENASLGDGDSYKVTHGISLRMLIFRKLKATKESPCAA